MRKAKSVEVVIEEVNGHEALVSPSNWAVRIPKEYYGMVGKGLLAYHKRTGAQIRLCIPANKASAGVGAKIEINPNLVYWSDGGMFAGVAKRY